MAAFVDNLSERDRAVLRSIFDPNATIGDVVDDSDHYEENDADPTTDDEKKAIALCAEGVKLAERNNLEEALLRLNSAAAAAPSWPGCYNDRAQLYRLMQNDEAAMSDLMKVLELTEGKKTKSRAQALCQRGLLLRKQGNDDAARRDFAQAAELGSAFARKQVVELNPYAALCNQMLSQVLKGEQEIKL